MMILILFNAIQKCILTVQIALKPNFMSSLLLCVVFLYIYNTYSSSLFKSKIFIFYALNSVFITVYHGKAV